MLIIEVTLLATSAAFQKSVYNVVVLGNTGVGKSAMLNMLAGRDAFNVGTQFKSETRSTSASVHTFLGKKDSVRLRLVDTQGLSDTGGDLNDQQHIKNMVDFIRTLDEIDLFLICFDGSNPRFTSYMKSTLSLFRHIFPDLLHHSVLVFNKWIYSDPTKAVNYKREFQAKFKNEYDIDKIPCFFIDSFANRKMLRDNDDGTETVRYLHPKIQERTLSQLVELMNYLVLKATTCDVRRIEPKDTEKMSLIKDKEVAAREIEQKRVELEEQMRKLKEANDQKLLEAQELSSAKMRMLTLKLNSKKTENGSGQFKSVFKIVRRVAKWLFSKDKSFDADILEDFVEYE